MTTPSSMTSAEVRRHLDVIEVKPGKRFSVGVLSDMLPTVEAILFFGKVYELDYVQLSSLMSKLIKTDLAEALFSGDHSTELQDYIVDALYPYAPNPTQGEVTFDADVPVGEILPQMWESLEIEVAASIKAVAAKLESVVGLLPGKQGKMLFTSMMTMNAKRPVLGDYRARVQHDRQRENLLVLDVSGSMTESTIRRIIDDVVALSYKANAHMAVVSNTCTYWTPGSYSTDDVLSACEFSGTHYEELVPLFNGRDWGTVITVADYDSSIDARETIRNDCSGSIDQLLDISLVNRPTFLAECLGILAADVKPLLIGNSRYVIS